MVSRDPRRRLADILTNVERIRDYIAGMTFDMFAKDIKTQDAVERCLERICEAARKIGPSLDDRYPEVEFIKIRDMGSVLRHDYDEVNIDLIWKTITTRMDMLEAACRREREGA